MADITAPESRQFLRQFEELIGQAGFENERLLAYDDATGLPITDPSKVRGNPTIGRGSNLSRADAARHLAAVGADFSKVRNGEEPLTRGQSRALLGLFAKESADWLFDHFRADADKIQHHQWLALLSLAYNSKWDKNGPTLIGPLLTRAVRYVDVDAAVREIKFNSCGGDTPLEHSAREEGGREVSLTRQAIRPSLCGWSPMAQIPFIGAAATASPTVSPFLANLIR